MMDGNIVAAVSAFAVALTTGFFTWIAATRKSQKDFQGNLNTSFRIMIEELQQERAEARKEIHGLRSDMQILRTDIHRLQNHIQTLEDILRSNNIEFQPIELNKFRRRSE